MKKSSLDHKALKPGAVVIDGHVQGLAITRSLGTQGIPVMIVETRPGIAKYSRYCRKSFISPPYESFELIEFLIKLAEEQNIKNWVLFPTNDYAVQNLSRNIASLSQYYRIFVPPINLTEQLQNKERLINCATECSIPVPFTFYLPEYKDSELEFPFIIKGKTGLEFYKTFRRKALVVHNMKEFSAKRDLIIKKYDLTKVMAQEIIPSAGDNPTVSYAAFCTDGRVKTYWMGAKLREHPARFGTATFAQSVHIQLLHEYSQRILKKLNYSGICEIEYLCHPRDGEYKLIEINARTWLWIGLATNCGIDFSLILYNYANNSLNNFKTQYELGKKWMHIYTDVFFSMREIIKGNLGMQEWLRSIKGKKSYAVFSKKDIKPFLLETIKLPILALRRKRM